MPTSFPSAFGVNVPSINKKKYVTPVAFFYVI
jgi:hypothetical protein